MDPQKAKVVSEKALIRVVQQQRASQKRLSSLSADKREFIERTAEKDDDLWVEDSQVSSCQAVKCHRHSSKFSLLNRRHHCRRCGKIFCSACSQKKIPIHGNLKRVCNNCYRDALGVDSPSPGFKVTNCSKFKVSRNDEGGVVLLPTSQKLHSNFIGRLKSNSSDSTRSKESLSNITNKHRDATTGIKENSEVSRQPLASTDSICSSTISTTDERSKSLPGLVEAIIVIGEDVNGDADLQAMRPRDCLSAQVVEEIVSMAIPVGLSREEKTELSFMFRVKNNSAEEALRVSSHDVLRHQEIENEPDFFYNCYVSFVQRSFDPESGTSGNESGDDSSSTYRQAIVLVSHWPSPQLFFEILHKLDEAYFLNILRSHDIEDDDNSHSDERNTEISILPVINRLGNRKNSLLEAAENLVISAAMQFANWPIPTAASANSVLTLPFMGETFNHLLPTYLPIHHTPDISLQFEGINLVSLLGPLGLLQHIWTLWAMVITGESILVLATSRSQCSEIAIALSTLMYPVIYKGDLRPVVNTSSSDCIQIGRTARDVANMTSKNYTNKTNRKTPATNFSILGYDEVNNAMINENLLPSHGIIVGTEDTALLRVFDRFTVVLFLPPPALSLENDSLRNGLQPKNAAEVADMTRGESYESCMARWVAKGSKRTVVATRKPLYGVTKKIDQNSVLKRLRSMSNRERTVLGDKLIKDRLEEMTKEFVRSYANSANVFMSDDEKKKMRQETSILQSMHNRAYLNNKDPSFKEPGAKYGHTKDRWIDEKENCQEEVSTTIWDIVTIPTLIYWILIIILIYKLYMMGLLALFIFAVYTGEIQYSAPPCFDEILISFVSKSYLYPYRRSKTPEFKRELSSGAYRNKVHVIETLSTSSKHANGADDNSGYDYNRIRQEKVDMTGVWKRIKCVNVDNYVGAQGAGYLQRKLAASVSMTHTITCDDNFSVFRIQEKAGPIDTDYVLIAGDTERKKNEVVQKNFLDKIYWEGEKLVQHRIIESGEYELFLSRTREGNQIVLNQLHRDLVTKVETNATSWFEYVKPSPNQKLPQPNLPLANIEDKENDKIDHDRNVSSSSTSQLRVDFSGVWKRVNTENFDAFIGAQGAGYVQRKLAVSMNLVHTITMDDSSFELMEVGGPLNNVSKLSIGANDFVNVTLMKKKYKEKAFWEGDSLVVQRVHVDNDHEMVLRRYLEGIDKETLRLVSLHRNLKNGQEIEAVSMFCKQK